jgi:hypothetical protein
MSRLGPFRVDAKLICLKALDCLNHYKIDATLTNSAGVEVSCQLYITTFVTDPLHVEYLYLTT